MAVSYHPYSDRLPLGAKPPGWGYLVADTNDPARIAKCMTKFLWAGVVWKDGHRGKDRFLYSDWCLMDMDDTYHQYPVEQAINDFADKVHIIGLTRNHRKDKDGKVCDRYRVAVPWTERITELEIYEGNMHALLDIKPALDASTVHGAQPFFRCTEIVSFAADGFHQDVLPVRWVDKREGGPELAKLIAAKTLDFEMRGRLPRWVESFLANGLAAPGRRHFKTLGAAIEMVECGLSGDDIRILLARVPISRSYRRGEVNDIIAHAFKEVAGRLRNGESEGEAGEGAGLPGVGEGLERNLVAQGKDGDGLLHHEAGQGDL